MTRRVGNIFIFIKNANEGELIEQAGLYCILFGHFVFLSLPSLRYVSSFSQENMKLVGKESIEILPPIPGLKVKYIIHT